MDFEKITGTAMSTPTGDILEMLDRIYLEEIRLQGKVKLLDERIQLYRGHWAGAEGDGKQTQLGEEASEMDHCVGVTSS